MTDRRGFPSIGGTTIPVPAGTPEDSRAAQAPGQGPHRSSPALAGRRIRPAGAHEGWDGGAVRGLSPPANIRHPAGVPPNQGRFLAEQEHQRQTALVVTSRSELDLAARDLEVGKATLGLAQRRLEAAGATRRGAEVKRSYATLTAPIAGVVGSVSTQEGETVERAHLCHDHRPETAAGRRLRG
jgi:multidrug efflux pump subunit AcrA (membrane-fusion protein)